MGRLSKVHTIWLDENSLVGQIPSELGDLESLKYLYLDRNMLSQEVPSSLGQLSDLGELYYCSQLTAIIRRLFRLLIPNIL